MVAFASGMTHRPAQWTTFAANLAAKVGSLQYEESPDHYDLWFYDGPEVNICLIFKGTVPDVIVANGYSQAQNDADKAAFEGGYKTTANKAIEKRSADGFDQTEATPRSGSKAQIISQDFCDPRTWYSTSTRKTGLVMTNTDILTGLIWKPPTPPTISGVDVTHGRILHESVLQSTYQPVVKLNGVALVEQDPHFGTGGDYTIDYPTMTVTMTQPHLGAHVTLDYSDVTNSQWFVTPSPGKNLRLVSVKLNYAVDVIMKDAFYFNVRAQVDLCPWLAAAWASGLYPAGTKLPLAPTLIYNSLRDLLLEANHAWPAVSASKTNTPGWRDLKADYADLVWEYEDQATIDLISAYGMDIQIGLVHDTPCTGSGAVVTFYCRSETP